MWSRVSSPCPRKTFRVFAESFPRCILPVGRLDYLNLIILPTGRLITTKPGADCPQTTALMHIEARERVDGESHGFGARAFFAAAASDSFAGGANRSTSFAARPT